MEIAAACLLGLLAYTYAGYPIVIAVLARVAGRPTTADPAWRPTVSVLVAVHDAAPLVAAKVRTLLAQDYPADRVELWFYSDASTDGTDDELAAIAAREPRVEWVRGEMRAGKPTALNELAARANGEVLILTDIRQELSESAISELVAALGDGTVGCAGGLLELEGQTGAGAYWRYERWIRANESRFRSVVGVSGSLYAIRAADFPRLPPDILLDDLYVPMTVRLGGRRVILVPSAIAIDHAASDGREFGRKVRTLAGNYQLVARLPALLVPGVNPSWFELGSHKLARLLCPWALIGLAVLSVAGAADSRWLAGLALAQALCYGAAIAGRLLGPIGSLARTFVVLNSAAVVGLFRWLRGSQRVTW